MVRLRALTQYFAGSVNDIAGKAASNAVPAAVVEAPIRWVCAARVSQHRRAPELSHIALNATLWRGPCSKMCVFVRATHQAVMDFGLRLGWEPGAAATRDRRGGAYAVRLPRPVRIIVIEVTFGTIENEHNSNISRGQDLFWPGVARMVH